MTTAPFLSVIVPAHQGADTLAECLAAIVAGDLPRAERELIVVNDGSTDDTAAIAAAHADTVLSVAGGPRGPAHARNLGALAARGEILLFVDADVVIAQRTLSQIAELFRSDASLAAAYGAYDRAPRHPGLVSQYRNLLHHYVHVTNAGDAETFWAGCGAVRRADFLAVGGFDARRYPRPQGEDLEFGYRLTDSGRHMRLVPAIQGTHLKRWTLARMLRTDLFDRAVPWTHLLLERRTLAGHGPLNVKPREKLLTLLAGVACLAVPVALVTRDPRWLWAAALCIVVIVAANAPLLAWFARERGSLFAVGVAPLRMLFYLVSGIGVLIALLTHPRRRVWPPLPPLVESSEHVAA